MDRAGLSCSWGCQGAACSRCKAATSRSKSLSWPCCCGKPHPFFFLVALQLHSDIEMNTARGKGRHGGSLPVTEEELSEHHFKGALACVDLSLELRALFPILSHSLLEQTALGVKLQPTGAAWRGSFLSGHKQGGFSLTLLPCSLAGATAPGGTD